MIKNKTERRIFGLDVIRAIAITIVVISHSSGIFKLHYLPRGSLANNKVVVANAPQNSSGHGAGLPKEEIQEGHVPKGRLWPLGVLGVELFFVLSGFLIGNILIRQFLNAEKFTIGVIKTFLVRRWMRTLPAYWFVLTILIFLLYINHYPINIRIFSYYIFLQNLVTPHPKFFREAWSLAVEEWFYLTLPFALYFATIIFKKVKKQKILLYTVLSYLLFFVFLRCVNEIKPIYGTDFDEGLRKVVIFRLDAVMYGVFAALALRYRDKPILHHKTLLLFLSISGVLIITYFMYYFEAGSVHSSSFFYMPFNYVFLYSLLPVSFSLSLPYASTYFQGKLKSKYIEHIITYVSKISYSIYLVHHSIFIYFFSSCHAGNYFYAALFFILYLLTIIFISNMLYKIIEQPFLRLRDAKFKKMPVFK